MKFILLFAGILLCGPFSGCSSTSGTIQAATTTLQVQDSTGKKFAISFPKELTASNFSLNLDPATGQSIVTADKIQTSSSQIIENAGNASAQATLAMAQAFQSISPLLAQAAQAAGAAAAVQPASPPKAALSLAAPGQSFSSGNLMAPRISSSGTVSSNLNAAFVYIIEASNSPTVFSETGGMAPGLVLEPHTGWIIGKPTVAGVYPVEILAANSAGSSSMALTITVK